MDFEVGNFYSYKHKNANFVKNLVLSSISESGICSLRNNTYHKIFPNAKTEYIIETLEEFSHILKSDFNYPIEDNDINYLFDNYVK